MHTTALWMKFGEISIFLNPQPILLTNKLLHKNWNAAKQVYLSKISLILFWKIPSK